MTIVTDRARRLLRFLRAMQEMRTRPVRTVDSYPRVFWLASVPTDDPRVGSAWTSDIESKEGIWLSLSRVDREEPPEPPDGLAPWVARADLFDSGLEQPRLLEDAELPVDTYTADGDRLQSTQPAALDDHPAVREIFAQWLPAWQKWAARDAADAALRTAYQGLYALYQEQRGQAETLEIVLGVGLLTGRPANIPVRRHLVVVGAVIELDLETGRLVVRADPENAQPRLEEDMLDPDRRVAAPISDRIRDELAGLPVVFGDQGAVAHIREWTNAFQHDSFFTDSMQRDETSVGTPVRGAAVRLAPALIVRPRGRESFLQAIETIEEALDVGIGVPAGLALILEEPELHDGGDEEEPLVDDEIYFPLAANEQQREINERLRRHRVVVVQGPPGTGKTHTIANLVTDLLAHGKRVLITSHGARALKVLKGQLPPEVRDLCVSLTDSSVRGQHDLQRSVETIIDRTTRRGRWTFRASDGSLNARFPRKGWRHARADQAPGRATAQAQHEGNTWAEAAPGSFAVRPRATGPTPARRYRSARPERTFPGGADGRERWPAVDHVRAALGVSATTRRRDSAIGSSLRHAVDLASSIVLVHLNLSRTGLRGFPTVTWALASARSCRVAVAALHGGAGMRDGSRSTSVRSAMRAPLKLRRSRRCCRPVLQLADRVRARLAV